MNHDLYKKHRCRYCDGPLGAPFLDLGTMPLANNLLERGDLAQKEFECPLSLTLCPECHLVQLTHVVPPEKMFSQYYYVSSTTKTFQDHFSEYAKAVRKKVLKSEKALAPHVVRDYGLSSCPSEYPRPDKAISGAPLGALAVDLGSNDGYLLDCYRKEGMRSVGVDPAKNIAEEANRKGLKTLNRFFDEACVRQILAEEGKAGVISANNVFAHVDNIPQLLKDVNLLLDERGFLVIEVPYLAVMLDTLVFDMIYHEHLSYIAVHPLRYVLNRFGFKIFDIQEVASHGGSLRVFIQKQNGPYPVSPVVERYLEEENRKGCLSLPALEKFAEQALRVRQQFMELIRALKKSGKTLSGYGAPAKASTITNFYGLTPEDIGYIVDDNPLKQGRYIPGARIPIVASGHMKTHPTDYVILFAWNFAKEILQKIGALKEEGVQFLVPLIGPDHLMAGTSSKSSFLV